MWNKAVSPELKRAGKERWAHEDSSFLEHSVCFLVVIHNPWFLLFLHSLTLWFKSCSLPDCPGRFLSWDFVLSPSILLSVQSTFPSEILGVFFIPSMTSVPYAPGILLTFSKRVSPVSMDWDLILHFLKGHLVMDRAVCSLLMANCCLWRDLHLFGLSLGY